VGSTKVVSQKVQGRHARDMQTSGHQVAEPV
jgi:hypothetical protein